MRILSQKMRSLLNNNDYNNMDFCYKITLSNDQILYLTSSSEAVSIKQQIYLPNSGIAVKKVSIDDSVIVTAELIGIFESGGIEDEYMLESMKLELILRLDEDIYTNIVTLYITQSTCQGANFLVSLKSIGMKLLNNITKTYSKTCRANLGDINCKVDVKQFAITFKIHKYDNNELWLHDLNNYPNNYLNWKASFKNIKNFIANCIKHDNYMIKLDKMIPKIELSTELITLTPICDKNFYTCYNRFKNIINFRGEPFI